MNDDLPGWNADLRERLAIALFHAEDAAADWDYFSDDVKSKYRAAADRLLPYVVGNMRRYAAMHLRDAADEVRARFGWAGGYGKALRTRADELDAPMTTSRRQCRDHDDRDGDGGRGR